MTSCGWIGKVGVADDLRLNLPGSLCGAVTSMVNLRGGQLPDAMSR